MEEGATPFPVLPQPDLDRVAEVRQTRSPQLESQELKGIDNITSLLT